MPAQRLTMRRVRELLRLHYGAGASARAIARELGVSRSTVKEYLARAATAELTWPLPAEFSDAVLEIVEDRYDAGSLLITSQLPIARWYEIIGDPTLADAILDRIVHNAYRIELQGDSLRKRRAAEIAG